MAARANSPTACTGSPISADDLSVVPRPRGRDLSRPELRAFVAELADWPELWVHLVRHDARQRHYEELLSDEHLTAWLICWMDDHDTGFHDHDVSAGAVAVAGGRIREERLTLGGPPRERVYAPGEVFDFSSADIHRVRHAGSGPAVTLHVYSPPLLRMGAYFADDSGVLTRHAAAAAEELRPLTNVAGPRAD